MKIYLKNVKEFWVSDTSFVTLLIMLLFTVFVLPVMIDTESESTLFLNIMFVSLFFAGIFSSKEPAMIVITSTLFLAHVILKLIRFSDTPFEYYMVEKVVGLLNLMVFIFINFKLLFRNDEINTYRIIGAVNVYLLLALFGAFVLEIIHIQTGASIIGDVKLVGGDQDFSDYIYYSLVCITTVGFGDIFPANVASKMLSVFLSATGILYPAVVIAKLVSSGSRKD
ncbi:hypothetical protein P872_09925 [Rhodonellum psychrophilum GCM71 = DSM 17998]|uniref:Potassium channel domain-containing protein n=2 Tax=Rhodonellum TaxID=336827 RepID=U5BV84_9BACT|nr:MULTISPECIES: potassium channel family protein [Rhodonellum]ERM81459.1 hypothetical protein P872_09925 [Rhodonellum psychrophilum GCM71 = DSM 17998]MDO9552818.1 potassium channel family protein [Rhodonellum sp.]SDZ27537.1 Ion channel [Rhodonellum ikkaensis]